MCHCEWNLLFWRLDLAYFRERKGKEGKELQSIERNPSLQ